MRQSFRQRCISDSEDLRSQKPGIEAPANGHGGNGNTAGHLHNRVQGIHTRKSPALHRHTNHREGGEGRHHPRQMSGTPCSGHDHTETLITGRPSELDHLQRRAMGR